MLLLPNMSCVFDEVITGLNDNYARSILNAPAGEEMTGYVHTLATGNAIFITDDCIPYFIAVDFIEHYHLQTGDRIRANVGFEMRYDHYMVTNIAQVTKVAYDDVTAVPSTQTYQLIGHQIDYGTTALITMDDHSNNIKRLAELAAELPNDVIPIVLSFDGRAESLAEYQHLYLTKTTQTSRDKLTTCLLAFFQAKELASCGKQVVVLVDSLDKMFTVFNNCMQKFGAIDPQHVSVAAATDLESLLCSSSCLSSGGSLTILGLHRPGISEPQKYITDRFHQLFDKII